MVAEISIRSAQSVEQNKPLPVSHALELVKNMESVTGIPIFDAIRTMIIKNNADSVSIRKENPRSAVYIRRVLDHISVSIEKPRNEVRVSIPQSSIDTASP